MEKLIELLKDQYGEDVTYNIQSDGGYMFHMSGFAVREERLLSKKFGFIKWLVENNKIDTRKIDEDRLETIQYSEKERITIYDWLLMLLSISENPIDFLIKLIQ